MGLFGKKKVAPVAGSSADDLWKVAEGENKGMPMFIRVNSSAEGSAGDPHFPIRLGIAIPLLDPSEYGLPDEIESQQLHEIEDRLFDAIKGNGRVVLIITTSGMGEFMSYVASTEAAEQIVGRVREASTTHEVQYYTATDPQWEAYRDFL